MILLPRPALVAIGLTLSACTDFATPDDPTGGLPDVAVTTPSFATDVAPIFEKRCSIGGCHSPGTEQRDLVLTPSEARLYLVGIESELHPGMDRVAPGDTANSWLLRMIGPDAAARDGRERMPLVSTPLTPNQIVTIRNWIQQGALNN